MGATRRATVLQPPATLCNTSVSGDTSDAATSVTKGPGGTSQRSCLTSQLRKTKICTYHLRGTCQYGNECAFAHSCTELQSTPDLRKTRLCEAFEAGSCTNPRCSFAHGEEELRSTNLFYKKTLCMWNQKGKCRNGDQCRFAHGASELRGSAPVSENSLAPLEAVASPTTDKGKKVSVAALPKEFENTVSSSLRFEPMKVITQSLAATQAQPLNLWPPGLGPGMDSLICGSGSSASGETTPPAVVEQHLKDEMAKLFEDVSMLADKCGQIHWQMQGNGGFTPDYLVGDPQWPNVWY